MPSRLRALGAEGRAEAVDLAERGCGRLVVELARLRQVRLLVAEVVNLEERRRALARGGRQDGCVAEDEAVAVEEVADGADDRVAHEEDGVLSSRAQPEVSVIHEELRAVLLRRDRVPFGALQDLCGHNVNLEAARRALVCAN